MSNILSEITRVREIMGVLKEQSNEEQVTATISGIVGKSDGAPVPNFPLRLVGEDWSGGEFEVASDSPVLETTSDEEGKYIFTVDPSGAPYYIVIEKIRNSGIDMSFPTPMTTAGGDVTLNIGIPDSALPKESDVEVDITEIITPSEEILAWAQNQIDNRELWVAEGVSDDWSESDIQGWQEDIIALRQDPVAFIKELEEMYCRWVDEGDSDFTEDCEEMTTLLATLTTIAGEDPTEEIVGCMDIEYVEFNPLATVSDDSCKTLKKKDDEKEDKKDEKKKKEKKKKDPTVNQLKKELETQWKKEVFQILKGIKKGDIFAFNDAYRLQKTDKLHALLKMLDSLMCVNAKIARTVILAEDNVYDASKLMSTAQFPKGGGHEGLINTIESNIKRVDKKFKLFSGGRKVDAKLKPIKDQLKQARQFINQVEPYLNWNDVEEKYGFKATTTEEVLLNSKSLNKIHSECASQIK